MLMVCPGLKVEVVLTVMTAWSSWMIQLGPASTSLSRGLRDWNCPDREPEIWTGVDSED